MAIRGQLLGIATRPAPRAAMELHASAPITRSRGVAADVRGKPGRRQVTVLTRDGWCAACAELGGAELPWTARRANLYIDGIELRGKVGYDLRIGDAVLTISGETRPCTRMDEAAPGLRRALEPAWRGGVTCTVTRSGQVAVGDRVVLDRAVVRQLGLAAHARLRRLVKHVRAVAGPAPLRRLVADVRLRARAMLRELGGA